MVIKAKGLRWLKTKTRARRPNPPSEAKDAAKAKEAAAKAKETEAKTKEVDPKAKNVLISEPSQKEDPHPPKAKA